MKIRTQFILTMLIFGFILAGISASVIVTNMLVRNVSNQENLAFDIAQGASELNYLGNEYMIHQETQQLERWQSWFTTFSNQVDKLQTNTPEQQALVGQIQANTLRIKDVFESVVSALETSLLEQQGALDPSVLKVSWSRMAVQSEALVSGVTRLTQSFSSEAHRLRNINNIAVILLVGLLCAYFLAMSILMQRRALKGIANLQNGVAVIGSGNLDFKVEENRKDEIGELSRAFNRMTADLKTVTASKTELEKEIGEREKAEKALRQSEEKYRNLFSSMSEGFALHEIILDASGKPYDYRFLEMNDAFEKLSGLSRENVIGKTVKEVIPDLEPYWIENYGHIAVSGEPLNFENFAAPLGKWYGIYAYSPTKNQFAALFSDITDRKKAEASLRETRDYLENLINYANAPIIVWDPAYRIRQFNHAFEKLTGRRAEEVIGKGLDILFPEDSREASVDYIHKTVSGEHWEVVEIPILRLDGTVRTVLWNSATIYAADDKTAIATIAQGQDITERKQAEEDLKRSNAELEAANKELEAFSYSVSHDLRAPLRSMEGFSNALLDDYGSKLDDQGRLYLRYVQESSQLMARLIDDLLELSRVTRSDMNYEDVDLSELAVAVSDQLGKAEPNKKVNMKISPGIMAYGDRNLLRIVLENLLGNAWKFTGKSPSPRVEMGITTKNDKSVYYVRDNGVGFDMAYVDKLFKPFQRLHKETEFEGTGIGLATVQRIVRRHGGEVWADSKVGEGATFYFTLE
jgi:PAS domain S-box-containing protein